MKWYKYNIRDLTSAEYAKWYALMSEDKQARVDRFRFEDDKKRTVAGEMLARRAIAEWCGVPKDSIIFDKTKRGKPFARDLPVEFNVSHSGDMVVCAVDNQPVGIDVERIRPINLAVARRICTEEELLYLFGHSPKKTEFTHTADQQILIRFFKMWTEKEACCKLTGVGIGELHSALNKCFVKTKHIIDAEYIGCLAVSI